MLTVMFMELMKKFATNNQENVYVEKVMEEFVVIVVLLVIMDILSVYLATVQQLEVVKMFVMQLENVHAYPTMLENNVTFVVLVIISIQNVLLVIVTLMVLVEFHVIMMDNVLVKITLTVKHVAHVKKDFTISQLVKNATVIQRVLYLSLLVVVQCLLENCVNVKKEFKDVFVINVVHYIGI